MSYERLLKHNEALRKHLAGILSIKESLSEGDFQQAVIVWESISEDERMDLWIAPLYGGVFTTRERELIRSDDFNRARISFLAEKHGDNF